ncbi:hypothetical protein D3C80_1324360 [compost metagenome]
MVQAGGRLAVDADARLQGRQPLLAQLDVVEAEQHLRGGAAEAEQHRRLLAAALAQGVDHRQDRREAGAAGDEDVRRALVLFAQEERPVRAAQSQHVLDLGLLLQIAGHRPARQQADQQLQPGQVGQGAGRRVAAQHAEAGHLDLHELAGAELQPVAVGQLQGQAHHVDGDALDGIDEGVHFTSHAGSDLAAVAQLEGAVRLRLAQAQQTLAGGVLTGQKGRAGAGTGVGLAFGELGDAARAAAGAALVEQRYVSSQRRIEDAGVGGDAEATADAVGEIQGDLVLRVFHE